MLKAARFTINAVDFLASRTESYEARQELDALGGLTMARPSSTRVPS